MEAEDCPQFEGAYPQLKFATQILRLGQSFVQPALLFFRTSAASRTTPRFLHEAQILPPLMYGTCVETLREIARSNSDVELHFADEEGDPFSVELAGRINGYVVGNDSDFIVLNSEGYQGYIPLDEMIWHSGGTEEDVLKTEDDSEFQAVRRPKGKRKTDLSTTKGIVPPPNATSLTLTFSAYKPTKLASVLNLPVTLLPLVASLVGNDFSQQPDGRRVLQGLFFERQSTPSQRITRAAIIIHSILNPNTQRKRAKHMIGSVMDLIERSVNALLLRPSSFGSGEIAEVVEKIVEATLQYAIPKYEGDTPGPAGLWASELCALHGLHVCPILPLFSRKVADLADGSEEQEYGLAVREDFIKSYRAGFLSPKLMDVLHTATYWPRLFLENPDYETASRSIARPIRRWIYSILDDALGLPEVQSEVDATEPPASTSTVDDLEVEEDDEDELIDVIESGSEDELESEIEDPLAPLKGALQKLHQDEGEDQSQEPEPIISLASSNTEPRPLALPRTQAPVIVEHIRRGTRIADERTIVTPISELLVTLPMARDTDPKDLVYPLLLTRSVDDRISIFLQILKSDLASIRSLSAEQIIPVLAIRWIIQTLSDRARETESKERQNERWTKAEGLIFLAASIFTDELKGARDIMASATTEYPTIVDRNVQMVAQFLTALEVIEQLAQVLLLADRFVLPTRAFSGKLVHTLLTANSPISPTAKGELKAALEATEDGLEAAYAEERNRRGKTKRARPPPSPPVASGRGQKMSLYGMLGQMDA